MRLSKITERGEMDRGEMDRGEIDRGEMDRGEVGRGEVDRGEPCPYGGCPLRVTLAINMRRCLVRPVSRRGRRRTRMARVVLC